MTPISASWFARFAWIFHKRPEAKLASKQSSRSREYQLQHDRGKD
jgi:hypothetical protein